MKNLTLLLFVSCFLYSQESTTENKIYHIITTDNDTIDISSYRIGYSLFGEVCEFTLTDGRQSKRTLDGVKKIEDFRGKELYPQGNTREVKKPITQIVELKYKRSSAGAFIALAGVVGIISILDEPPIYSDDDVDWYDWEDRQYFYDWIIYGSLVGGGIAILLRDNKRIENINAKKTE